MRYTTFCVLLLAVCEPLLTHAEKVLLFYPRHVRRSPGAPWRGPHYKTSSYGNEYHNHAYRSPTSYYQKTTTIRKPLYKNPPFPHGGDDFDHSHEEHVNHVHIPHGKDVSHTITFGKGYIPYDSIKSGISFGHERHQGRPGQRYTEPEYASTSYTSPSAGSDYTSSSRHPFENLHSQSDSYFSDESSHDRKNDRSKFYASRSIDKDIGLKNYQDSLNSAIEREKEAVQREIFKDSLPQNHQTEGAIVLPDGVPAATIGGKQEGIVLRDSISLDEYHRTLDELTRSWPTTLTGGAYQNPGYQQSFQQTFGQFNSDFPTSWTEYAQPKQGYAVKEEVSDTPHDFRTMPIQTSPLQGIPSGGNNFAVHG